MTLIMTIHLLMINSASTLVFPIVDTGAVDKPCAPFKVPISPTKKPETPSSLASNESSSSLLSRDVPGYEILTQTVRDMQENVTVMKMLQSHYSNKNKS